MIRGLKTRFVIVVLTMVALMSVGCSRYPESQEKITLITGGYGYEVGDIVLVDQQKEPEIGDIVQYDARVNKSFAMAFGSGVYLAKIIGLPGDNVSFERWSYEANGYKVSQERYYKANGTTYEHWPNTRIVMWGTVKYEDVANMVLTVPNNEYLADRFIGLEATGEIDETGSSKTYHRFTIKREAIRGVLLKKLGHDKEFEEAQKNIVY